MPGEVNIQTLFSQLRLEHLLVYLPAKGWQGAAEVRANRLRFEFNNGESPYVVSLPRSNSSAQCRTLLQKAIYMLSCVEDRQPGEIMHDVLAVDTRQHAVSSGGTKVRLRLSNSDGVRPISLRIGSRPGECLLMPGEALEIVTDATDAAGCEIVFKTVEG